MAVMNGTNGVHIDPREVYKGYVKPEADDLSGVRWDLDSPVFKFLTRIEGKYVEREGHIKGCKDMHCRTHDELFPMFKKEYCLTTELYVFSVFPTTIMCHHCVELLGKVSQIGKVTKYSIR